MRLWVVPQAAFLLFVQLFASSFPWDIYTFFLKKKVGGGLGEKDMDF